MQVYFRLMISTFRESLAKRASFSIILVSRVKRSNVEDGHVIHLHPQMNKHKEDGQEVNKYTDR
jgi:hypothetical protein